MCFKASRLDIPKNAVIREFSFVKRPIDRRHIDEQVFEAAFDNIFHRLGRKIWWNIVLAVLLREF